ncbi:MAG: restriction endonuclease subunit S [Thalassolituus sp.]|uniref:restriction endonuclease subunit S n=1 Tax=Thalassolituus sp. TaxID=2030822 RepID=UPI00398298F3
MDVIAKMPTYEAYKESGYEWIGNVPSSWDISKLGSCLFPVSIKNHPDQPLLSITREQGVIQRDVEDQDSNHNYIPDDLSGYKLLKEGQFGMNKMKAWQGSYGVSSFTGIVSPAYFVFDFIKPISPSFFNWAIRSKLYVSFFGSASDGVRVGQWDLSKSRMKVIPFLIPSTEEQTLIANFLDQKAAHIDEAIAIKEQQIALLKERKQIIIQKAVTQGLNPDVPMKDSGVDWIGEIPAHWAISKIGHYARVYNGSTPSRDSKRYWENGTIPWMSSGKVNEYLISTPSELITESAFRECSLRFFPKGTVLVGIVGQGKTRGTSARLAIDAAINQNVAGIIPSDELLSEFLHQYLIQAYDEVRNCGQGSNQEALNCQILSAFKIAFPPAVEQKNIVDFIAGQSESINKAIGLQLLQIEKLREYKTTLINSAVTGKIRITPEMVE